MRALRFICVLGLLWLPLGGTACIGGQTGSESKDSAALDKTEPCDPFAPQPDAIAVEYFARAESGELLLVLRPAEAFQYEDARLFYGEADALAERAVTSFTRAKDGGSTHILFDLAGVQADAFFPVESEGDRFVPGQATLTAQGETTDLERLDATTADAALLEDAQLRCLLDR